MNNKINFILKSTIAIAVLLIAISVFYYYAILPQQKIELQKQEQASREKQEQIDKLFAKNVECQKYKEQVDENDGLFGMTVLSGIFYSSKINSCLYAGLDKFDNKIKIKDAITGQIIFSEELKDMKLGGNVEEEINAQIEKYK